MSWSTNLLPRCIFYSIALLIILLLAGMLLPARSKSFKSRRNPATACVSNLKQITVAFANFEYEHEGKSPMEILKESTSFPRGSSNLPNVEAILLYKSMASTLKNPKVLTCPTVKSNEATRWDQLRITNVSYFVEMNRSRSRAHDIVAGDANLLENGKALPLSFSFKRNSDYSWGNHLHGPRFGNVSLADGAVKSLNTNKLNQFVREGLSYK